MRGQRMSLPLHARPEVGASSVLLGLSTSASSTNRLPKFARRWFLCFGASYQKQRHIHTTHAMLRQLQRIKHDSCNWTWYDIIRLTSTSNGTGWMKAFGCVCFSSWSRLFYRRVWCGSSLRVGRYSPYADFCSAPCFAWSLYKVSLTPCLCRWVVQFFSTVLRATWRK